MGGVQPAFCQRWGRWRVQDAAGGRLWNAEDGATPLEGLEEADLRWARLYAATQSAVVDKTPFFQRLWQELSGRMPEAGALSVWEPGVGDGGFLRHVWERAGVLPEDRLRLVGWDRSAAMIRVAWERLCGIEPAPGAEVELVSGVDLVAEPEAFPAESFSAIVLSQFEHFFPVSKGSVLAQRWRRRGIEPLTRGELRRRCWERLRPGGLLAVVEDFREETEAEEEASLRRWDQAVVARFSDPHVLEKIRAASAEAAEVVGACYPEDLGPARLLARAGRLRRQRRLRCLEEVEEFASAWRDYCALPGLREIRAHVHPEPALGRFRLLICQKK